jgi:hypothetical protein
LSQGEAQFEEFFVERDLVPERFTKAELRSGKTPDFKVLKDEELMFFCEVKDIREDEKLDELLDHAEPGEIVGYDGNDPTYSRVATKIHQAVKQFDAVNFEHQSPNVLAFFNLEDTCDWMDVIAVITGGLPCDDGSWFHGFRKFSEGRIKDDKWSIDLYLWMERSGEPRYFFTEQREQHHGLLIRLFGIDENLIRRLP